MCVCECVCVCVCVEKELLCVSVLGGGSNDLYRFVYGACGLAYLIYRIRVCMREGKET